MAKSKPSPGKTVTIRPDHFAEVRRNTHILYRCFNRKNALLYVGMTNHPESRFESHRKDKPWWNYVHQITMTSFSSRTELVRAEAKAIQEEKPRFNVVVPTGGLPSPNVNRNLWPEASRFGTVVPEYGFLINMTLEQQLYPCVECHAKAIYAQGEKISCGLCSAEWTFDKWFAMTFHNECDTAEGAQMTLL